MKRYGLIGHPLGHSYSKAYFTEKFEQEKIDACYDLFDLSDIYQLPDLLRQHSDLHGFNVTIPYKEVIIPFLDEIHPEAKAVGAVNTVKVTADGKLIGFNTDIVGIETTLYVKEIETAGLSLRGRTTRQPEDSLNALVLGTGGASKAVQYVLKNNKTPFHLVSRSPKKGHFTYETLTPEIIKDHLLIINATPIGMAPNIDETPLIPSEAITPHHFLFDLIYNPEETLFLRNGRNHGATIINGMKMLHAQAEASWKIWIS